MAAPTPFESLQLQLKIVTDRVRAVAAGKSSGLYLFGRPGTAKTFTVRTTLDALGIAYEYEAGRLTPIGLFELLAEHPGKILVLDDVSSLFESTSAVQILLAALGNQPGGRKVRYKTARVDRVVDFTGGVIAISNLALIGHQTRLLQALQDRIHVIQYEPTDEQVISLMRHLADQSLRDVRAADANMVLDFLLAECQRREIPPSLRLFFDKAIPDFQLHRAQLCELDWRDLIVSDLEQQLIQPVHPALDLRRSDEIASERRLAAEIYQRFPNREQRVQEWKQKTGKGQASFYRRLKEVESSNWDSN